MTRVRGPNGPNTSFSEETGRGIDHEQAGGCQYVTPSGECGDPGVRHEVGGVRLELCHGHLEAVLQENDLTAPPRSPRGRLARRARA